MSGWVYYCRDGRERIKIGYSINPKSRLSEFKTVNPEIELMLSERGDRNLEQKRHEQFRDEHIAGEWFFHSERLHEWICLLQATFRVEWSINKQWAWASVFPSDAGCTFNLYYEDGRSAGDIDNPPEEWLRKGMV